MPADLAVVEPAVAALVLAAGAGTRLRPLTDLLPKPLCPVGEAPMLDHALARLAALPADVDVVVNVHHGAARIAEHLERRLAGTIDDDGSVRLHVSTRRRAPVGGQRPVHLSWESPVALGTAGALARLAPWLDGRGVLVVNADAWTDLPVGALLAGWDGRRPRVLTPDGGPGFGPAAAVAGAVVPWPVVRSLPRQPCGLWASLWRDAAADGSLEVVTAPGRVIDCGTPAGYLAANLERRGALECRAPAGMDVPGSWVGAGAVVSGRAERCVVGAGASVEGEAVECVIWPGGHVAAGEELRRAVRAPSAAGDLTVFVR